ncbi:hypothetical protein BG011_006976 [Mortierella polycephala]|uniref:Uncharacterized protein n=1 Tax=Mortierella polycephala TaxID=41804 RepID=A0A9P6U902_9FUNG|nr:hypothetical protein BG011_006976 [Mortierella polycephala]
MLFSTRAYLQVLIVAIVLMVVTVEAVPKGCYRSCVKSGEPEAYCRKSCLDAACYRSCTNPESQKDATSTN